MSRNNNVRGPTSALTEFLKEQGITARTIVERRRRVEEANANANAEAGPSTSASVDRASDDAMDVDQDVGATVGNGRAPRRRLQSRPSNGDGYGSDELDESEPEEKPAGKKRKLGKAALVKLKAKEKAKAKKNKKKGDDDDYSDASEEDEYTALSKGGFTRTGRGAVLPAPGSFEDCASCAKQFVVTRYTMASRDGNGFLCNPCAKSSGADPFKKPAAPRKKKDASDKRKITNFEEPDRVKSLAAMCIDVIGKHIEDVEMLGDIGSFNMDNIARVLAKNRSLTPQNVQLFYDIRNEALKIYDATNLSNDALCTMASLNPNLQNLRLDFCGRIMDDALVHWSSHLKSLKRVELLGPFLIRVPGWLTFLEERGPQLEGFLITQSPRFNHECIEALVRDAPGLIELRLSRVGKLNDDWVPHLTKFTNLTALDLSYTSTSLSDQGIIDLLEVLGQNLTTLNLSGNEELTDAALLDGILAHTKNLNSLSLADAPLVTDQGFAELFNNWTENPPLEYLDFGRDHLPESAALQAILKHSGSVLVKLSINGWKDLSNEVLLKLGEQALNLVEVDLGFCRSVDNFVMQGLLDSCEKIQEIKCYGCNRVTIDCPRKKGVRIFGVEGHSKQ